MTTLRKIGPYGGSSGETWDEKGRANIAQIIITYEPNFIYSLQFVYVEDGKSVVSEVYGKEGGTKFKIVTLDHETEHITGISGRCRRSYVNRLKIETNVRTIGPFGDGDYIAGCYDFSLNLGPGNHFGGFHGSFYNSRLESIGVYVDPSPGLPNSHNSPPPKMGYDHLLDPFQMPFSP